MSKYADVKITKEDFEAYVDVQMSGVTNMWAVTVVMDLTGLRKEQCFAIMDRYAELNEEYGVV